MRSFSASFTSKLAANSYTPVLFCQYELITYVSGATAGTGELVVTDYYWSERAITYDGHFYESRIINTAALEQVMDSSMQAFGDMGLQIANAPTNLTGAIQAGMKCVVYLGFEDSAGVVTDAEVMFTGVVEGGIEITEDSVSFGLTDIAHTYDRQLPDLVSREEFPLADPDAIGDTKSIIMGRVRDLTCRPVAAGLASVLAHDAYDTTKFIWLSHDVGWWANTFIGTTLGKFPIMTINSAAGDEDVRIERLEYDKDFGTWKAHLTAYLELPHLIGDTVYQKYPDPEIETDNASSMYAYLVADHAVEKISNVKVDGMPVPYKAFTNLNYGDLYDIDMAESWNLPMGKAYILVPTKPAGVVAAGSASLGIIDTLGVADTIGVVDDLTLDESGHNHAGSGADLFTWSINYNVTASYLLGYHCGLKIEAISGSDSIVIADLPSIPTTLSNPVRFSSTSPDIYIKAEVNCGKIYYLEFSVERIDPLGVSTFDIETSGETYGDHGEWVSNLSFPEYYPDSSTGISLAGVIRVGDISKTGSATKTGSIKLTGGNSAADIFIGQKVTCDVIGNCDGAHGYVQPNEQIKRLINKYATNPIVGTEGYANIVQYVNSADMDVEFNRLYNTSDITRVASDIYPAMNESTLADGNPSPTALLGNTDQVEGCNALDFAITEPNRLRDIVGDMLFHSNSHINWRNGIAYIRQSSDNITSDGAIGSTDLIMKSTTLSRSKASDLATDIDVRYNYSAATDYARRFDYAEKVGKGRTYTKTKLDAIRARGIHRKERVYDLPMASEQVTAELVAKRLYDDRSSPKYSAGISSSLKNLAYEVGDYIDVSVPIYANAVLAKGLVERRTLQFGSAVGKQADLIHLSIKESHAGSFHLATSNKTDSLSIADDSLAFILNDVHTIFHNLSDTVGISEYLSVQPVVQLADTIAISEALAFEYELSLTEALGITDYVRRFTGILFWHTSVLEELAIADLATVTEVDGCYEAGVYVTTDTETIGVYE